MSTPTRAVRKAATKIRIQIETWKPAASGLTPVEPRWNVVLVPKCGDANQAAV